MADEAAHGAEGDDATTSTTVTIEPTKLNLGFQVVDYLKAHSGVVRGLVRRIYTLGRLAIIPESIMLPTLDGVWELLAGNTTMGETARLSTISTTLEEYCRRIGGRNLRRETIGNVLVMASICLVHMPESEAVLLDLRRSFRKAETLPHLLDMANQMAVCLKYNQMLLASQKWGYSNLWVCSSLGGAHILRVCHGHPSELPPSRADQYPGFMSQWRRRCFAVISSMDKIVATVFGRPPFLSRHYCSLEPPLDVHDDNNDHSFSTAFDIYIRLRFLLSTVREEVLELHLGTERVDLPLRTGQESHNLRTIWNSCPPHLEYNASMWTSHLPCDVWPLFSLYLEHQYSLFLIHRLSAYQRPPDQSSDLISVARDILSTVIVLNNERENLRAIRSDFGGVLLPFGLPCAEVLLTEVLRQTSTPAARVPRTPRAETVRDLTIFVSCLSWATSRGSGHFEFGQTVQANLTRRLDQLLDQSGNDHGGAAVGDDSELLELGLGLDSFIDWDIAGLQDPRFELFCGSIL
ncbi:hypothetical protein BO71DRAFT_462728 [Aspergillus ellipticus CBS 707.79]|uniref:Xylanolytic transcriptional activator regulatory domain-containing protein n=1 Tax=Aspergillus ellipticus CBS 707.79 TaxID=1448320 RepID=A0A319DKV7_9EURO|nr:hypothetical protein BO71DRAFT_462728 [Aspergillus ellipticus CBS 707.79]